MSRTFKSFTTFHKQYIPEKNAEMTCNFTTVEEKQRLVRQNFPIVTLRGDGLGANNR